MEKDLDNRVMNLVRRNAEVIHKNEIILTSMSDQEIKEHIKMIGEIRKHTKKPEES